MPLTPEQKRAFLIENGFDPDHFDAVPVEELGRSPSPAAAPSVGPPSTALGAAYRGAKRSLVPSLAGIGTTAALAAIPGLGPIAAVALPLIGGLGAGYGASYLQEKIAPTTPEEAAQRAADVKEHPYASFGGELVPQLFAMKPSIANVAGAFKRLPAAGLSEAEDAARAAILSKRLTVGLGAGLGALSEVGVPLATGEPISPLRAASATIAGGLLNEPNKLGRMIGFHPPGALRPSLGPEINPRVGYEGAIGPEDIRPRQPTFYSSPGGETMSPEAYEFYKRYQEQQSAPRPAPPAEPSIGIGLHDVEIGRQVVPDERQVYIGQHEESGPEFEARIAIENKEARIRQIEKDIADVEGTLRHLPLQEQIAKKLVLEEAKGKLAQEKLNLAADAQAQRIAFVAKNGEVTQPKPQYVTPTPKDVIAQEQDKIQKQTQPKVQNATNPIAQPQSGQPEHLGVSQGQNVLANPQEVRQGKGRQAGNRGRVLGGQEEVAGWAKSPEVQFGSFKANDPNLTPEMKAQLPKTWEFTDRRAGSPTEGMTVYVPEGSAPKIIQKAIADKTSQVQQAAAIRESTARLTLRSELGLNAEETTKLLQAKTPFDRGMTLLTALQKRGIKVQDLTTTPQGHRVAITEALKQAADTVKRITGKEVTFKPGVDEPPETMHQVESELAKAPLSDLLGNSKNREVMALLESLAARQGIAIGLEPNLMTPQGEVALGLAMIKARVAALNPTLLAEDTLAHEISHIALRDMIASQDPLAIRGLALFGGNEERLVQALGSKVTELANLRVEGLTLKRFTAWVREFISAIKAKWGNPTEEDFRRLLARRILNGDFTPARLVVTAPEEVMYQKLVNGQQDTRESLEAALAGRTIAVEHGMPGMRSVVDRIRREVHPDLGDGLANVDTEAARYRGRFTNKAQSGVESLNAAERRQALDYVYNVKDTKGNPTIQVSDKVLDWYEKSYRPFIRDVAAAHREVGKKIIEGGEGRDIIETPYYTPEMLREDIQELMATRPNDPQAVKFRDMIVQHIADERGISKEEAFGLWESRGRAEHVSNQEGMLEYGPLSRAAGIGLPAEVRENDLNRLVTRYGNRSASALAWHKEVVANPKVAYLAGVLDQYGNSYPKPSDLPADVQPYGRVPIVSEAIKLLKGDFSPSDRFFDSFSRGVKVMMMQTLTGGADLVSWWSQVMPYIHPSRLDNIVKAHFNVAQGIKDGLAMGVIQKHALQMQSVVESGEAKGAGKWITRFNKMADLINMITGRDGLERVTRGLTMILGEMEATANIAHVFNPQSAKGLRDHAARFLDTFADKDWAKQIGDIVKASQPVPDEVIHRIAANLVDAAQGTYGIRGLPLAALKGEISPFLSLAKWNIEKANSFQKHVWAPMLKGNITPFLMTTAGGLIGGAAVEQLREWMTKRKGAQATWGEIAEAGGKGSLYKAMALSTFSGYGGIITELAKQGMDAVEGRPVTGFRFPAVAFIADTVERASQAFHAVKQGENLLDTFGLELPLQLLKDHIQMARIGLSWADSEDIAKSNQLRDLRTFRELHNIPTARWEGTGRNPFLSPLEHEYEKSENPQEIVPMAAQLRQQAMERSRGPAGQVDPERLRSLLNSYRAPSTDVMPSMRSNPLQFRAYLEWVRQTKGEDEARKLLSDYVHKEQLDAMKRGLIPSMTGR
jgi:hypothetical protein